MSARQLFHDVHHALKTFLDLDEDGLIEVWDRVAVFDLDTPHTAAFAELPSAEDPPEAFLLMTREVDDRPVYELWWAVEAEDEDAWPVVQLDADGEGVILAANARDYIDALLLTGGVLGGGSEDELDAAREDAHPDGAALAGDLLDELDRSLPDVEALGERWDDAQDTWGDAWVDAIEGIED